MRRAILTLAGLSLLGAGPARAEDYKVGDKVVVIHDNVQVKVRTDKVDKVGRGMRFVVREVQGEWIEISRGKPGFIEKQHVIPFTQAVEYWSGVIRSNQDDLVAYSARGYAYQELQAFDRAIVDFNEVIRRDASNASAYSARGLCRADRREYDKAIADYNEAIRLQGSSGSDAMERAVDYNNRGIAWRKNGDNGKAIADFDEAIRIAPKYANPYNNRGIAFGTKGESDRAIRDFNEAIRLDPKYALAYSNRGNAWSDKGEYDNAIADYTDAIRLDPEDPYPYNNCAWLWATCPDARVRDGKKAVENATKACELDGWKIPEDIATLAAAYAEAGDFDAAVKWQTKATEMVPKSAKAYYRSLLALYQQRKPYRDESKK